MAAWQVKGLQLFAALSLLIILHEFGHFFFAKLFKTRVEKFYLFFDFLFPFGNVLNFSLFKKKKGETEYGIGWFPLGGYVKIAGMVDESMDKEQMALPPQPWEFRSKKAWQRLFIMLGGIIVNVLLAMIIYSFVFAVWGEYYLPARNVKYGVAVDSTAAGMGLRDGDKILTLDGKPVEKFAKIATAIVFNGVKTVGIERDGQPMDITVPAGSVGKILKNKTGGFIEPRVPFVVDSVVKETEAAKMGLRKGDSVVAVNGTPIRFFDEFKKTMIATPEGQPIQLTVIGTDGQPREVLGSVPKSKALGLVRKIDTCYLQYETKKYGFFAAIGRGVSFTGTQFSFYMAQFKLLFTSKEVKLSENIGGIGTFASIFPPEFEWQSFWMLTAFISIVLAFMNLLPIPGLDGGYVLFLLWEMITGRKVNDKVMEWATTIGLIVLLGFMLYANGLDIFRVFKK